jgi:hypothetical protein
MSDFYETAESVRRRDAETLTHLMEWRRKRERRREWIETGALWLLFSLIFAGLLGVGGRLG